MKLTKSQIKRLIKEEYQALLKENEEFGHQKQSATAAQKAGRETLKDAGKASPQERAVINNLLQLLTTAAGSGNIASGTSGKLIQKLQQALQAYIKAPAEEAP